MRTWKKRIIKWLWIPMAILIATVIFIVKVLPLLPDEELADSDLIPVYQEVAAEKNPMPALQLGFKQAASGSGTDHSKEIGEFLSEGDVKNFDTISQLMASDTRQAALSAAAKYPISQWRYPEYKHHSRPLPILSELTPTFRQKMRWLEWLEAASMPERAAEQLIECLAIAGGLLGSDGGFGSLMQGLSAHSVVLSEDSEERVVFDRLLQQCAGDVVTIGRILECLNQTDLILKTVAEQTLKREYLATTKSALEDFRAGNAEVFEKEAGAGSFRINQTLNRIAVERRRMIAVMAEPLDLAPLTREDTNDRIDVDFWSMAKAYLRGNASGHVIVAISQPTLGSLPRALAERRKIVRDYRCVCATAMYRLLFGKAPTSFEDLVEKKLLDAVPKDPFSGERLEFSFEP